MCQNNADSVYLFLQFKRQPLQLLDVKKILHCLKILLIRTYIHKEHNLYFRTRNWWAIKKKTTQFHAGWDKM